LANTNSFDGTIAASTGDLWAASFDTNALATYVPLQLDPGQAGTIGLTITPNALPGTMMHGFIALDTFNFAFFSGDELVNIPYTYTVG
jgi:hypothetical protein